jgi:hypothetical protein
MKGFSSNWYDDYLKRQAATAAGRPAVDRTQGEAQASQPESASSDESLAAEEGKAENPGRCFIGIESRRKRLIDPRANLYGGSKYIEDACMYAGALHDDDQEFSEGIVTQTKVGKDEEEVTIIRIWKLDRPE